jgi:hypothetical protein
MPGWGGNRDGPPKRELAEAGWRDCPARRLRQGLKSSTIARFLERPARGGPAKTENPRKP